MQNNTLSLKTGVVGLIGAATMGTVMLSPAMTLYGNFGPTYSAAGKAAPLVFILALLATIPTAISYALMARDYPESGSAQAWTTRAVSKNAGQWTGWMVFLYYFTAFVMQPVTLGLFFNDLLTAFHIPTGFWTYLIGAVGCSILPARLVFKGINPSTNGALMFLLVEAGVVGALCLMVSIFNPTPGETLSMSGFMFSSASDGMHGIFKGMVFAMLSFTGFDVISTLSEETHMPRRLIPQATFLSIMMFGLFVITGIWALTYATTPENLRAMANSSGMPITEIARMYWGKGSILIAITGLSAGLGIAIATSVGASRVLFSMGREGQAPKFLARLNPETQVPSNALRLIFLVGLGGALLVGGLTSPYMAYVWWGTTTLFFAMITYLAVNVSNLMINRRRAFKSLLNVTLYLLVPTFGIAVDAYILYQSFFVELWSQPWATGKSIVVVDVACAIVALGFVMRRHRTDSATEVLAPSET